MNWFKLRFVMKLHFLNFQTPVALFATLAFLFAIWFIVPARGAEIKFPVPPQQYELWRAPDTKLTTEIVVATRELFVLGLADPRGGEYREITITVGDVWGRVQEVKTHGWVLPQTNFAIAWNGLVYPLKSSGERVNLRDDLSNLPPYELRQALSEPDAVSYPPRSLIGVCLLLRLGESAAAENLWHAARRSPLADTNTKRAPPLEELSSHWAWAMWNRALCAHLRGADDLALSDARQLRQLQPLTEAKAKAERLKAKNKTPFRLSFLAPLRQLLTDQERRARENNLPASSDDSAALINNLQNVSARQWGQPGGVDLTTSPLVQEIIARGEEVVPALLDAVAQDYRLTRSVSFHRDYFTNRHLIGAAEAAYAALCKISDQSFGPITDIAAGGKKRAALVKNARAHWKLQGESAKTNQLLAVLQNDKATPPQWFEAANSLFVGNPPVVSSLDKSQSAQLAALIAKRIENATAPIDRVSGKESVARASELLQRLYEADVMAQWLTDWSKAAALPVLRNLWKRHTSAGTARLMTLAPKADAIATLQTFPTACIIRRVKLGDTTAFNDYSVWLKAQRDNKNWQENGIFEPLWRYPAQTTALAEEIFNGKTSLWNPLIDPRRAGQLNAFVAGPLLAVPAYRAQVVRQLKNWAKCGTIEIMAEDKMLVRTPLEKIEETLLRDATSPPIGAKNEFRVCDFYARQLSQILGAPRCELYWSFAKRDRAVNEISKWLQDYGARLRPASDGAIPSALLPAKIAFPLLNRTATSDDVKNHSAIFSLQGLGNTRVVAMKLPAQAKWKNASVWIWQAEEIAVGSEWRRHYGIIATHEIRRVPANEIQLMKAK